MFRNQRSARPLLAVLGACVLGACSLTPPERINDQGQRVQRVCVEEQGASGSRLNSRKCRDVVVGEAEPAESANVGEQRSRD